MRLFKVDTERFTPDFNDMLKIVMLNSSGFFFLGFLIPILARTNMMASGFEVSLIISIQVLGRTISGIIIGYISDRTKSRTKLVLIGSFGRGLSYFIIYIAIILNSLLLLGLGTMTLGFMAGVFWVPFNILIAEKSNKDNRSQAYGKRNSANAIGQMIGALIGFNILLIFSFFTNDPKFLYSCIPIYGIANFYAGMKFYKGVNESIIFIQKDNYENNFDIKKGLRNSNSNNDGKKKVLMLGTLFLMIVLLFSSINNSIARPFINIYLVEKIESDIRLATYAYIPAGLAATLIAPKLGAIIDKIKPKIAILITSSLGALVTWLLINVYDLISFSFILLLDLTIAISADLLFQNVLSRISKKHRGKVFGTSDFFTFLGNVIGPIIGGLSWDILGPKSPFIFSIFFELMLIPLYFAVISLLLPNIEETYEKKPLHQ